MEDLIRTFFPPLETALELQPEELAVYLLPMLCTLERQGRSGDLHCYNFTLPTRWKAYAGNKAEQVARVVAEAWAWLEREILIAPRPGAEGQVFVTRRGRQFHDSNDPRLFRAAGLLPSGTLDAALAAKVRGLFQRGDYDGAVLAAYKELEVRVRALAALPASALGVDLMRKAFDPGEGPLTDKSAVRAEREALSHLYAGAFGSFKNPASHRDLNLEDPVEAAELIMLADLLIRIAERHAQAKKGSP
jgi:uncharacterized protein (TIGR02391 family)